MESTFWQIATSGSNAASGGTLLRENSLPLLDRDRRDETGSLPGGEQPEPGNFRRKIDVGRISHPAHRFDAEESRAAATVPAGQVAILKIEFIDDPPSVPPKLRPVSRRSWRQRKHRRNRSLPGGTLPAEKRKLLSAPRPEFPRRQPPLRMDRPAPLLPEGDLHKRLLHLRQTERSVESEPERHRRFAPVHQFEAVTEQAGKKFEAAPRFKRMRKSGVLRLILSEAAEQYHSVRRLPLQLPRPVQQQSVQMVALLRLVDR